MWDCPKSTEHSVQCVHASSLVWGPFSFPIDRPKMTPRQHKEKLAKLQFILYQSTHHCSLWQTPQRGTELSSKDSCPSHLWGQGSAQKWSVTVVEINSSVRVPSWCSGFTWRRVSASHGLRVGQGLRFFTCGLCRMPFFLVVNLSWSHS